MIQHASVESFRFIIEIASLLPKVGRIKEMGDLLVDILYNCLEVA